MRRLISTASRGDKAIICQALSGLSEAITAGARKALLEVELSEGGALVQRRAALQVRGATGTVVGG